MAQMNQSALNNMCSKMNSAGESFTNAVATGAKNYAEDMNENWCSNASQRLAGEVKTCLDELCNSVVTVFSDVNSNISSAVKNFNTAEEEDISYLGFSISKPDTSSLSSINSALPNGKVGVSENYDLTNLKAEVTTLTQNVYSALEDITAAVDAADAFDSVEKDTLKTRLSSCQSKFSEVFDEFLSSLDSRLSGEQSSRVSLEEANLSLLGA